MKVRMISTILTATLLMAFVISCSGDNNPELYKIDQEIICQLDSIAYYEMFVDSVEQIVSLNDNVWVGEGENDSVVIWITLDSSISRPTFIGSRRKVMQRWDKDEITYPQVIQSLNRLEQLSSSGHKLYPFFGKDVYKVIRKFHKRFITGGLRNQAYHKNNLQNLYIKRAAYK